jgi:Flp pilus assembly protein TadG
MHRNNRLSQFKDRCRRLRRGLLLDDGIAGIETALLIPLIMVAFLGSAEIYFYIRAVSAVERVAFTLADTLG